MRLNERKLRAALQCVADATSHARVSNTLGGITLHPYQRDAIARVDDRLQRFGGVLLAEEVGRGKTFIALAIASRYQDPLIVAPASLRDAWQLAMKRSGVRCAFVSHEALSAGRLPSVSPDLVLIDESHRFRNTATRRHREIARLATHARVLLLSATPLQNARADLVAQLSLFLGGAAGVMSNAELASHLVRSSSGEAAGLPRVAPPAWVPLRCDDGAVLEAILGLPVPPRPLDAGDAGVLRIFSLVRAWASSRAALRATLRRRSRTLAAIEQCAADGRVPTSAELRSWSGDQGAVQLGFTPLLAGTRAREATMDALIEAVMDEGAALDRIHALMRASADPDPARVEAVRDLRARHGDEKLIIFTELSSTAGMIASALIPDGEVGLLTASRARIASGSLSRRDLLERFAPLANGMSPPAARERVSLLVATDLLSEGVNLQDASVVVHLDLPWNPARLTQRMGRVRRPGGREVVHGYLIAPPAHAEQLLRVEQRLRAKLASAEAVVGTSFSVVPVLSREGMVASRRRPSGLASAESRGDMLRLIASWRRFGAQVSPRTGHQRARAIVAGVECPRRGGLAVTRDGRIVAWLDGAVEEVDCAPVVVGLVHEHEARPRPVGIAEIRDAIHSASAALARDRVIRECGVSIASSPVRDAVTQRVGELLAMAPRHHRARLAAPAGIIRRACSHPLSLGIERELSLLLKASAADADPSAFMEQAAALLAHGRPSTREEAFDDQLVALILLGSATPAEADDAQCAQ